MRRVWLLSLASALLLAACGQREVDAGLSKQNLSPQRYIVLLKSNSVSADTVSRITAAGGEVVRTLPEVGIAVAVSSSPTFAADAAKVADVQSVAASFAEALPQAVTEDVAVPESPTAADSLYNGGLVWGVQRVRAPEAWARGVTGSKQTVVAVIDTGIATNHPDLAPNIVFTACYTSLPTCNPYPSLSDHGTHVAGTIAAVFGGGRVIGVGPNLGLAGYNTFQNIPGCGVCSFTDSRWAAMLDAAERGFEVINMSLGSRAQYGGGKGTNDLATFVAADNRVADYVIRKGTTIVASAGNSALDLNGTWINLPGGLSGVMNIGATGIRPAPRYQPGVSTDVKSFFSNYGASLALAAPGGDCGMPNDCNPATRPANYAEYLILSTIVAPNAACAATRSCATGYGWKGGTSMAAPHVAGVAGLVKDVNPGLNPHQVSALIRRTAEPLGDNQQFGAGMVDANAATQ